ncbi:hypothetical protein Emed_005283 [Eimeria media]
MSARLLFTLFILNIAFVAAASAGSLHETTQVGVGEPLVIEAKTSGPPRAVRGSQAPRSIQPLVLLIGLVTSIAVTFIMLLCFRAARDLGRRNEGNARRLASDDSSEGGDGADKGLSGLCQSSDVGVDAS